LSDVLLARRDVAERLAEELFAVVGVLAAEPSLRRALTDTSRSGSERADLVRALFGSKVQPATLDVLAAVAAARWSTPSDLVTALERLAVYAAAEAADQHGHLDDLEDELFRFGRVLVASPDLRTVLSNPLAPAGLKRELLDRLLGGKVTPAAMTLITEAAVHPRGRSLDASLTEYARLVAEWRRRLVAVVRAATPLDAGQRDRLGAALAAAYGREVHLNVIVDPQLVGGMSIRIGDELIDGSVASRLAALRRQLAA
jgi:F-type H+-transporting ATPase subunit delta